MRSHPEKLACRIESEVEGILVTFVTCNYRYDALSSTIRSGFKMLPTNNSYYSSTSFPTVRAIAVHGSATIDGGEKRDPPSET